MSTAASADDFDFAAEAERWSDWEPSAEDCRNMIDAEGEALYDAWLESSEPFDFTGSSYMPEYEGCSAARPHTDWTRRLDHAIEGLRLGMIEGKSAMIVDRADLGWMIDFDEGCFDSPERLPDAHEDIFKIGLGVETLAAGRLLDQRDPTFWPRLRKLGPTPELVTEANNMLGGHEFGRESRNRTRPVVQALAPRRRACSRARSSRGGAPGRRQGSRRVTSRSGGGGSSGSDDDGGGSEPPPGLGLWRHDAWGACSPELLRILIREGRS